MILREIKNMYFPALQQIEYLESNGMQYIGGKRAPGLQYIDTGVLMDSANAFIGTTVEFEVLELATDINNTALIAGALTSVYDGYNCLVYQGDIYLGNCFSFSQTEQALNMKTTATIYKNVDYIPNQNFILFGRSIGSSDKIEYFGIKRIYSCKIIKNGDTIRDFIPVRVGTKGYMFDKVFGELYGNSGTGDFVLGPDVGYINSSKNLQQIYQNKLIEGVDYETYDWLKGDGSAYIDTKVTDLSLSDYIKTIFDDSRNIGVHIRTWGRETTKGTNSRLVVGNDGYSTVLKVWGTNSEFIYNNGGIYVYDMYFDLLNNKVTVNGQTHNLALPHGNGSSFILFAKHTTNASGFSDVNLAKFKSFEIHNQINLVPCTLLHSIPRNLDAQCKERVAGECGMIDLISGKFYGNVASSGTFTVENDSNE